MKIPNLDIAIGIFTIIFLVRIWQTKKFWPMLNSLKNYWLVATTIVIVYITSNYTNDIVLTESLKKAIMAFIIAFFASHDVVAAPFYVILIFSYYSSGWL